MNRAKYQNFVLFFGFLLQIIPLSGKVIASTFWGMEV